MFYITCVISGLRSLKFKHQMSHVFQGAVHSPVLSDVTKQAVAISELAESLTAFKQHR